MSTNNPSYGKPNREYGMRLASTPPEEDGPILMVNLIKYRERAVYADGSDRGASGREADDRYAPVDVLSKIGAEVALFADVDAQLDPGSPRWDRVGCVLYPTRRSFIEMQSRTDFQERHVHKEAGIETTIVMGSCLIPSSIEGTGLQRDWKDVEHPPTSEDGPVVVMHVIRFAEDDAAEHMHEYHSAAFEVAARQGARIAGWYRVEDTILGDGRVWHEVRFNQFPSKAADGSAKRTSSARYCRHLRAPTAPDDQPPAWRAAVARLRHVPGDVEGPSGYQTPSLHSRAGGDPLDRMRQRVECQSAIPLNS
jgi:hypothetical protein